MIYLLSMFPESYAYREMQYTKQFLDHKAGTTVAKLIRSPQDMPRTIRSTDWFVIADYKIHPLYWDKIDLTKSIEDCELWKQWDNCINRIAVGQRIAWAGDIRFNYQLPCRGMICNNNMMFAQMSQEDQAHNSAIIFKNQGIREIFTWQDMCPELPERYTLAETCVDWFTPFDYLPRLAHIMYVINGGMKYKRTLLETLRGVKSNLLLGNWPNSKYDFLKEFAIDNPQHRYISKKVYGADWLSLMSTGKYTIVAGDDERSIKGLLVTRFWEGVRVGSIPLIRLADDPDKLIYKGYPTLKKNCYFETAEDIDKVVQEGNFDLMSIELKSLKERYIGNVNIN